MNDVIEVDVPKTVGTDGKAALRIDIRSDEYTLGPGLFIYGFLPESNAEKQGLLQIGDELLTINDIDVERGTIADLVNAMENEDFSSSSSVNMMIRRQTDQTRHVSNVSTPFLKTEEKLAIPHNSYLDGIEESSTNELIIKNDADLKSGSIDGFVLEIDVPKTDNDLQLDIRRNPPAFGTGLFLMGYLIENSCAENVGALQIGDEVLEVNGINVAGGSKSDVDAILRDDVFPDVLLKVYRTSKKFNISLDNKSEESEVPSHVMPSLTNLQPLEHDSESDDMSKHVQAKVPSYPSHNTVTMPSLGNLQPINYDSDPEQIESPRDVNVVIDVKNSFHPSSPVKESDFDESMASAYQSNDSFSYREQHALGKRRQIDHSIGHSLNLDNMEKRNSRLHTFSNAIFEVEIPKTNGEINIDIRSDENAFGPGLFVYGFSPHSLVEQQGLVHVGDEILSVNGISVDGGSQLDLAEAMSRNANSASQSIKLKLRRVSNTPHVMNISQSSAPGLETSKSAISFTEGDVDEPTPNIDEKNSGLQARSLSSHHSGTMSRAGNHFQNVEDGMLSNNMDMQQVTYSFGQPIQSTPGLLTGPRAGTVIANRSFSSVPSFSEQSPSFTQGDMRLGHDISTWSILSAEKRNARLSAAPSSFYDVEVPKTGGRLKIDIRSDENIFGPGLFVYGFAPHSLAEKQGMLHVGDELLSVNGQNVDGSTLEELSKILQQPHYRQSPTVRLRIRRLIDSSHVANVSQLSYSSLPDITHSAISTSQLDGDTRQSSANDGKQVPVTHDSTLECNSVDKTPMSSTESEKLESETGFHTKSTFKVDTKGSFLDPEPVLSLTEFMNAQVEANNNNSKVKAKAKTMIQTNPGDMSGSNPSGDGEPVLSLTEFMNSRNEKNSESVESDSDKKKGNTEPVLSLTEFMNAQAEAKNNNSKVKAKAKTMIQTNPGSNPSGDDEPVLSLTEFMNSRNEKNRESVESDSDKKKGNTEPVLSLTEFMNAQAEAKNNNSKVKAKAKTMIQTNPGSNPSGDGEPVLSLTEFMKDRSGNRFEFHNDPISRNDNTHTLFTNDKSGTKLPRYSSLHGKTDVQNKNTLSIEKRNFSQTTMSGTVFEVEVPKTNGRLKVDIRCDKNIFGTGLFIFGCAPGSMAEKHGMLRLGDEVLAINGQNVVGFSLSEMVALLHLDEVQDSPTVMLKLRRMNDMKHVVELSEVSYSSIPDGRIAGNVEDSLSEEIQVEKVEEDEETTVPGTTFEVDVPKTGGKLKIDIRNDEQMFGPGLFVLGFAPGSKADQQDILKIGDELLAVNGQDVYGGSVDNLSAVMRSEANSSMSKMRLRLKRRPRDSFQGKLNVNNHHYSVPDTQQGIMNVSPYPRTENRYGGFYSSAPLNNNLALEKNAEPPTFQNIPLHSDHKEMERYDALNSASFVQLYNNASIDSFGNDHFDVLEDDVPLTFRDFEILVPKTDGHLRIVINEDIEEKGLFVEGFGPDSNAGHQGMLRVGDEFISVNGINVAAGTIDDIVYALDNGQNNNNDDVVVIVRRYFEEGEDMEEYEDIGEASNSFLQGQQQSFYNDHSYVTEPKGMRDHFEDVESDSMITAMKSNGYVTSQSDAIEYAPQNKLLSMLDRDMSMVALQVLLGDMEKEVKVLVENEKMGVNENNTNLATQSCDNAESVTSKMMEEYVDIDSNLRKPNQGTQFSIAAFSAFFFDNIVKQSMSSAQTKLRVTELEEKRTYLEKMLNSIIALRVKQEMENNKEKKVLEDQLTEANRKVENLKKNPSKLSGGNSSTSPNAPNSMQEKINAILEKEKKDKINKILEKEKSQKEGHAQSNTKSEKVSAGFSLEKIANAATLSTSPPKIESQKAKNKKSLIVNKSNKPTFSLESLASTRHINEFTKKKSEFTAFSDKIDRKISAMSSASNKRSFDLEALVKRADAQRNDKRSSKDMTSIRHASSQLPHGKKMSYTSIKSSHQGESLDLEALVRRAEAKRAASRRESDLDSARKSALRPPISQRSSVVKRVGVENVSSECARKHSSRQRLDLNAIAQQAFKRTEQSGLRIRTTSGDSPARSSKSGQQIDALGNINSNNIRESQRKQTNRALHMAVVTEKNKHFDGIGNLLPRKSSGATASKDKHFDGLGNLLPRKSSAAASSKDQRVKKFEPLPRHNNFNGVGNEIQSPNSLRSEGRIDDSTDHNIDGLGNFLGKPTSNHTQIAHNSFVPVEQPAMKNFGGKTLSADSSRESISYSNGDAYEGAMKNGKRHGRGKFTWSNGDVYTGNFVEDEKSGMGKTVYNNGDIFEGYRVKDKKNGKGKYVFSNGCCYDGVYMDDFFHGKGVFKSNEGWIYDGEWCHGAAEGYGKLVYANGDVYTGSFCRDMRNGKGRVDFIDGSIFEGVFVDDEKCGYGKLIYPDRKIEEGEFKNDVLVFPKTMENDSINSGLIYPSQSRVPDQSFTKSVETAAKNVSDPSPTDSNENVSKKNISVLKKRQIVKCSPPSLREIIRSSSITLVGDVLKSVVGADAFMVFSVAADSVEKNIHSVLEKLAPTSTVLTVWESISESGSLERDTSTNEVANVGVESADTTHFPEKNVDIVETTESNSEPLPPAGSSHPNRFNRPVRDLYHKKSRLVSKELKTQQSIQPETEDILANTDQLVFASDMPAVQSEEEVPDNIVMTDEERAAKFFPKKNRKHYEDIKLGKAITNLLKSDDTSKLQKYLKPETDFFPSNDGTIALIQRIRRELNLPGNKGMDPKSISISSDLEKELIDEDIAYVDEMAIDYNSFISDNKEASATWSSVDIPRLGSSVFKNIASESVFLRKDQQAQSPFLQEAVASAGIPTPIKDEWLQIFNEAPTAKTRAEERLLREDAINKKSPYYLSVQALHKSKSRSSNIKVGNPCSASNMRSRKALSGGAQPLHSTPMKINSSDGAPTLQSTMRLKSGSKDSSFQTFELLVPKTQNGLMIQFAHSSSSKIRKSLSIKALAPGSNVQKQGILREKDEILEVNSVSVKGKYIDDIMRIISRDTDSFILLLVRRANKGM